MESYHKGKKLLEEKYDKIINLKPYSDDYGIADNKQQKYIKQTTDFTDDEGLRLAYETKMDCINIIINCLSQERRTSQLTTSMI